jgi:hypothetical protein
MPSAENGPNMVRYIDDEDVRVVLGRLPTAVTSNLNEVNLRTVVGGVRCLGWVTRRRSVGGRYALQVCSRLPPRVSLRDFLVPEQSAEEFGAPLRGQWPPWAVRRFLLYSTLLHELGHLQIVDRRAPAARRFAHERRAEEFADLWRRRLYSEHLEDAATVHNPPSNDELATLEVLHRLNKPDRYTLATMVLGRKGWHPRHLAFLGALTSAQEGFLVKEVGPRNKRARGSTDACSWWDFVHKLKRADGLAADDGRGSLSSRFERDSSRQAGKCSQD